MIDFIKCIDIRLPVEQLLNGERLLFPLAVDEQTGAVLEAPRRAHDQGITFTLIPSSLRPPLRCELKGSLHRYHNGGTHNASDYTAVDLAETLTELTQTYQIDLTQSLLNNMEFGVNVILPFPVSQVLNNLISYKNRSFNREVGEGFAYYQCATQRYVVKLYDKGAQYRDEVPDLPHNLLRVEIKVLKMEYLTRQGIGVRSMADLLDAQYYPKLGQLLVDAFSDILFDEPSIDRSQLKPRQLERYLDGRNAKYWLLDDALPTSRYNAQRQKLHRDLIAFRQLLRQHRMGDDQQALVAGLIAQCWQRLTIPLNKSSGGNRYKLTGIEELERENRYELTDFSDNSNENRYKLTGSTELDQLTEVRSNEWKLTSDEGQNRNGLTEFEPAPSTDETLQINHLSIGLNCNIVSKVKEPIVVSHGTLDEEEHPAHSTMICNQSAPAVSSSSSSSDFPSAGPVECEPVERGSIQLPMEKVRTSPKPIFARCCAITGVDISHQNRFTRTVTVATLDDIRQSDADRFNQIVDQFCPLPGQPVAEHWQTQNLLRLIQEAEQHPQAPRKRLRACPVTGIDTTHQPLTSPTLTHRTLTHLSLDKLDVLAERYLTPEQNRSSARIDKLASRLRQINVSQQNESTHSLLRHCPVTGIDITQQRADTVVAGQKTLERMIIHEPGRLDLLSVQLLTPDQQQQPIALRCAWLAYLIQQRYEQQRAVAKADY